MSVVIIQRVWRSYRARRTIYRTLMYASLVQRGEIELIDVPKTYLYLCKRILGTP
jgi:hypothetical protein